MELNGKTPPARLKVYGYYLIEPFHVPPDSGFFPVSVILSVSDCLCRLHPEMDWGRYGRAEEDYPRSMGLSPREAQQLREAAEEFMDCWVADNFPTLAGARRVLSLLSSSGRELELVSISFAGEDDRAMRAAVERERGAAPQADEPECGEFLGFDIVGYECGSFHSWLCNALYKDVEESYGLKFNSFGLLENDWEEVCAMTAAIQGIGEPVVWTPCVVRRYAAE